MFWGEDKIFRVFVSFSCFVVIMDSRLEMKAVGGGGSAIARWVNFDRTFDLIMFALSCGVVCFDDLAAI